MFDLAFVGTSDSVPLAECNHPSLLVVVGGKRVLVDCGEGTQRQLLRSGAGFRGLERLLLTHGHFDHVLGRIGQVRQDEGRTGFALRWCSQGHRRQTQR